MPDPPSRLAAFLAELKRRRVFRVAIVYAGVAFIICQIVDATFDYLPIPDYLAQYNTWASPTKRDRGLDYLATSPS